LDRWSWDVPVRRPTEENGDYREVCTRTFGKCLTLPEPFAVDLETAEFL